MSAGFGGGACLCPGPQDPREAHLPTQHSRVKRAATLPQPHLPVFDIGDLESTCTLGITDGVPEGGQVIPGWAHQVGTAQQLLLGHLNALRGHVLWGHGALCI